MGSSSTERRLRKRSLRPPTLKEDTGEELILTVYKKYVGRFGVYGAHNSSNAPQNVHVPGKRLKIDPKQRSLIEITSEEKSEDASTLKIKNIVKGGHLHRIWLFFATLTDRRQVSMSVYKSHVEIYSKHPELYTKAVIKMSPKELASILITYRIGCPNQSATYWITCAKTLFCDFDGDPLKLLAHCNNSVEGIVEYKREQKKKKNMGYDPLPGYGPKIASLYTLFLAELGKIKMPDDSMPIDVHVQRIFIQCGAIINHSNTYNEELEDILRVFICKIALKYNLNKVCLSHAFWQLGRTLCNGCYRAKGTEYLCPVFERCAGSIETKKYYSDGIWPKLEESVFAKKGLVFSIQPESDSNLHLFSNS